ncbi:hypothetical protein [Bradyrhizobium sp.]|uniref:hypothetical protein n=1 Tax=Bradyrhizobium sp. TaxID=376 RepID=UPI0025C022C2|nr:hypothetical protein [Bradyrhizobium sp.]
MMIPVHGGENSNERLAEIADILSLGLQRLTARQSSNFSADRGESSLHISPDQSGGASPCFAEISDG